MTPAESLQQFLRALRGEMTQEQAAAAVGVGREVWNGWENGRRGLGELNANRIATAFGLDPQQVLRFVTPRGQQNEVLALLERIDARVERLEQVLLGGQGASQGLPGAPE